MKRVIAAAGAVLVLASCSAPPPPAPPPADPARDLAAKVTADAMYTHLQKLSDIGEPRVPGTPGYEAAVDYIAGALRDNGFEVSTPEFEWLQMGAPGRPTLEVAGKRFDIDQGSPLAPTPAGGVTAPSVRPAKPSGCAAADYRNARGALVIVDDKGCSVVDKQNAAVAAGAAGLLLVSAGGVPGLFPPGYYRQLTVPVAVIGSDTDAALRRTTAPVKLILDGKANLARSRNIVAQTKTGGTENVVVAGANLDSAPGSPGINDNATGVAALLATATALGSAPTVTNAVRFTFWGSESLGAAGKYLAGLDPGQRDDIAVYLDADMLGSPNAGYFTFDGDQSGQPNPEITAVPEGSAGVERTLAGYLNLAGVRPADIPLDRTSDYSAFLAAGIPVGGLTTGSSQKKSAVQARLWGGKAGVPFDPNFRGPRDDIGNVDRHALSLTGPAIAFAIGTYAQSIEGANGLPPRDTRHHQP